MDVEAVLLQYCKNQKNCRSWAIIGCCKNIDVLCQSCTLLKENNVQLAALIRLLNTENCANDSQYFNSIDTSLPEFSVEKSLWLNCNKKI